MALHYGAMLRECIRHQSVARYQRYTPPINPNPCPTPFSNRKHTHLHNKMVPKPLSLSTAVVGGRKPIMLGGWWPIKDLKSAEVQEVAQFAMSEHDKQANEKLQYQRVVQGHTQVVAGTNYRLVIAAKDGAVLGELRGNRLG